MRCGYLQLMQVQISRTLSQTFPLSYQGDPWRSYVRLNTGNEHYRLRSFTLKYFQNVAAANWTSYEVTMRKNERGHDSVYCKNSHTVWPNEFHSKDHYIIFSHSREESKMKGNI